MIDTRLLIERLLAAPVEAAPCEDVASWWARHRALAAEWQDPTALAIAGGFAADRVITSYSIHYTKLYDEHAVRAELGGHVLDHLARAEGLAAAQAMERLGLVQRRRLLRLRREQQARQSYNFV